MPTDPARIEFTLDNDPHLLRGVMAIVCHAAQRSGFSQQDQDALAAAAVDACRETFPLLNGNDSSLRLVVLDFPDRVEVTIEHSGEVLPTAGLDSFCAGAEEGSRGISSALLNTTIDRVQYDTKEGHARMTLTKYRAGAAPQA
jgi:hypothetical protein